MKPTFLTWSQRPFRMEPLLTSGVSFLFTLLPPWSSIHARSLHHFQHIQKWDLTPTSFVSSPAYLSLLLLPLSGTWTHTRFLLTAAHPLSLSSNITTHWGLSCCSHHSPWSSYITGFSVPYCKNLFNWLLPPFYFKTYEARNQVCLNPHSIPSS